MTDWRKPGVTQTFKDPELNKLVYLALNRVAHGYDLGRNVVATAYGEVYGHAAGLMLVIDGSPPKGSVWIPITNGQFAVTMTASGIIHKISPDQGCRLWEAVEKILTYLGVDNRSWSSGVRLAKEIENG